MQVDDNVAAVIVAQLLFLEAENPEKPISLYINSPGGSVTAGMAIYDTVSVLLLLLLYFGSPSLMQKLTLIYRCRYNTLGRIDEMQTPA